jgi:hypothetical protein
VHSVSLGFTWFHLVSLGVTRCHSVSLGVTRCHSVSLGVTRCHLDSVSRHSVSLGFTWFHMVSLGFACVTWFHLVSHGFTWFHLVQAKGHTGPQHTADSGDLVVTQQYERSAAQQDSLNFISIDDPPTSAPLFLLPL